ncbi:3-oxoacyl-ACP reductase FabG [Streptomyces roseirectus]|uniref:3-oxoacyl-ACP reductase FabG n=1 Tax=Streptomyces roseirectus TaxID=2768066 RepID=A0A7H0IB68_9ACTN|nr:3-oxoacyl-ACP reductase family protein [Streptomyces roseirectus]QNP70034.1 3-oxoacyl-ACP reductase FabG [Streptomyces roseirectus]
MKRLEGHVALVTGGSRGIGAAVAVRLAEEGADVVVTYERRAEAAGEVVRRIEDAGRRGVAVQADCAVPEAPADAVEEAVSAFGRLDVLVNNAAVFPTGPIDAWKVDEVDRTLAVNVRAPFLAAQAAVRYMGRGGRIISVGSNVADRVPFPGLALYSMSKTALEGMTRGLARELGPRGITVNLLHPGPTDTDANPADGPNAGGIAGFTAVGRYAEPAEIAATVAHLAGPEGAFITGASIHVDGGFTG